MLAGSCRGISGHSHGRCQPLHEHLSITVCTIGSSPKIYQKVTDIYYELIQNLYIQSQKSDYMEMKISVNDHHTSENV